MFEKSVNAHRGHDDCRRASSTLSFRIDGPSDHFETVTHFLREDYTGLHELCDVNLRFNTDILPVHSVVLSANSTTLARKFRLANKCYDVDLSFLSKESVERILEYLYTGSITFCFESLHSDLDAISYLGVSKLQKSVEKKLIEIASHKRCVDVLNMATATLKTIPHSLSTMLSISDETVSDLVNILYDKFVTNQMAYEDILKLSTNTVITMLSSRISDSKKVEIINMALKWIYERRLSDAKASSILRVVTFGGLTYSQLIAFRDTLIQSAVPVTIGRCVRVKHQENLIDFVFMHAENSGIHTMPENLKTTTKSVSYIADPTLPFTSPTGSSVTPSSQTVFENATASSSSSFNIDDCSTAISFDVEDLKRLGFDKPQK